MWTCGEIYLTKELSVEDKYIWIENIKSFSGRHRLKGDIAVGASLWYPDFFEESQKIMFANSKEKVYHLLNMETIIGSSTISSAPKRVKYKTKAQKRVAYLESFAKGIKVCARENLTQVVSLELTNYQHINESFMLDNILSSKSAIKDLMSSAYRDEFEYLVFELSRGALLVRLSFSFWLFFISFRSSTI